jgi:hypothetical protein
MQPTKLDRLMGATLGGAYDRGPASGTDYFGNTGQAQGTANLNPGQQALDDDTSAPDAGYRDISPERIGNMSGGGRGGYDSGIGVGNAGFNANDAARALGLGSAAVGLGARAMQDPGLGQLSGALGIGSAAASAIGGNYAPAAGWGVGLATSNPALGGLASLGVGAMQGNVTGKTAANSVLGYAVPGYGLANALSGGKIGDAAFGTDARLAQQGTMTAPAQPGFTGLNLGRQTIGPTTDSRGMPTSGTQMGQVASPEGGYSFSSATSPTGLAGQMGQVTAMPTGFNQTTVAPTSPLAGTTPATGSAAARSSGGNLSTAQSAPMGSAAYSNAVNARAAQTAARQGRGGSSGGGGFGPNAGSSPGGRSTGGGYGAGGWADGGMIGEDAPGLTQRYMDGGQVGGQPMLAQGYMDGGQVQMGATPSNASVEQQVNQLLRNPQQKQRMVAHAQQLMATGELTPDEVMTMAQVAEAAMMNPSLYPQLRQFVAEQGMGPLPEAYDPGVIVKIIAISRALQQAQPATEPGMVPGTDQAQMEPPVPGMANGGYLRGPGTGRSDSIGTVNETTGAPVKVANGEYVIPEHVVRAKGREFFDNLLRRYADVSKEQA